MNTLTPSVLNRVFETIQEIAEASADDDYIYRGEPEHYDKVSSSLYREVPEIEELEGMRFDIALFQEDVLEEAKTYISKTDDIDETDDIGILTQLQHFGGKTNLIDFTEDYLIALFFACDGSHEKDGRVILLRRKSEDYEVKTPRRKITRVESQKSVFVESLDGFVEPDFAVTIPAELKLPIFNYLGKHHRISIETIYNDLHGFIRRSAHAEWLKGLTCQRKASESENDKKKPEHLENAITHYTEALKLKPNFDMAYTNRGIAYGHKDEVDSAFKDFNTAIDLNPQGFEAYIHRGIVFISRGEANSAIKDCSKAIELNLQYAQAYCLRGLAFLMKDEFCRAIKDFNKAIELKSDYAAAYNKRGDAYCQKGDFDQAIQDCSKAIELKPEYAEAYSDRGMAYCQKGDFDQAIQDCSKAIELKPEDAATYYLRGITYAARGDFDAAIEDYSKVIDLNPKNPEDGIVYANRGEAWLHLRDWEKAKADLTAAKDMDFDIIASFHKDYKSVEDFEAKHQVKVPKDIKALLQGTESGDEIITDGQLQRKKFWTELRDYMSENDSQLRFPNPPPESVLAFGMGSSNFSLQAYFRTRLKAIGITLYVRGENATAHFHLLKEQQAEIKEEFGEPLEWEEAELPKDKSHKIYLRREETDPGDERDWPNQHEWLASRLELFYEVFLPRIQELDAAAWEPPEDEDDA